MKGVGKGSFPGVRRPIPGAETGGRASRCTHPGDEQPPVCDSGPGIPESRTVKRLPPSSPGSSDRPRPLPGAGPGVAKALLSDPAPLFNAWKVARDTGSRPGVRLGTKQSPGWPDPPPQLCAAGTKGERKKKNKPFVPWRKRLSSSFSQIHRNYCIYPVRRSLVKINGCKLFKIKKKNSYL